MILRVESIERLHEYWLVFLAFNCLYKHRAGFQSTVIIIIFFQRNHCCKFFLHFFFFLVLFRLKQIMLKFLFLSCWKSSRFFWFDRDGFKFWDFFRFPSISSCMFVPSTIRAEQIRYVHYFFWLEGILRCSTNINLIELKSL